MTMEHIARETRSTEEMLAAWGAADAKAAHVAARWGAEAVWRAYPHEVTPRHGYRHMRPGHWYLRRDGEWVRATPAQARELNRIPDLIRTPYGSVGPINSLLKKG